MKIYFENAASNPFFVTPYGVFVKPAHSDEVTFRDAGAGNFVRTFISPLNTEEMVHGTDAVLMHHAYLFCAGCFLWKKDIYRDESEKLIQWATGHNTTGICLFTGIGFRQPVIASFVNYRIPDATVDGFIGRLDDIPIWRLQMLLNGIPRKFGVFLLLSCYWRSNILVMFN